MITIVITIYIIYIMVIKHIYGSVVSSQSSHWSDHVSMQFTDGDAKRHQTTIDGRWPLGLISSKKTISDGIVSSLSPNNAMQCWLIPWKSHIFSGISMQFPSFSRYHWHPFFRRWSHQLRSGISARLLKNSDRDFRNSEMRWSSLQGNPKENSRVKAMSRRCQGGKLRCRSKIHETI